MIIEFKVEMILMILEMDCQIAFSVAVMSTTYDDATNILSFEGLIAGKYYVIVPEPTCK